MGLLIISSISGCMWLPSNNLDNKTARVEPTQNTSVTPTETTFQGRQTTLTGGHLYVVVVHNVPEDAPITNSTDPRIEDQRILQETIDAAVQYNTSSGAILSNDEKKKVQSALNKIEIYRGPGPNGYYIRVRNQVVNVIIEVRE